jgi:hypothetical protein
MTMSELIALAKNKEPRPKARLDLRESLQTLTQPHLEVHAAAGHGGS